MRGFEMAPSANGVSNGHAREAPADEWRAKRSLRENLLDIALFLVACVGYIVQSLVWVVLGRPRKELQGGIALVTGGGSGLGRLLALRLARLKCTVVLWDINKDGLDETCKLVTSLGGVCKGYVVDLAKRDDVYRAAALVKKEVGRVSLLINNAGVASGTMFLNTPDHIIQRTFDVNILAHFWTTKAFLPEMIEADEGHVVTIASMAGHVGVAKLVDYCSSKYAAVGFDESLRAELEFIKAKGVNTTVICPFFITSTGMFEDVRSRFVPQLNSNDVADRVIKAIRTNEKFAIIPGYLRLLLTMKWMFPWGCVSQLMTRILPDAIPEPPTTVPNHVSSPVESKKDNNEMPVRRSVTAERKP